MGYRLLILCALLFGLPAYAAAPSDAAIAAEVCAREYGRIATQHQVHLQTSKTPVVSDEGLREVYRGNSEIHHVGDPELRKDLVSWGFPPDVEYWMDTKYGAMRARNKDELVVPMILMRSEAGYVAGADTYMLPVGRCSAGSVVMDFPKVVYQAFESDKSAVLQAEEVISRALGKRVELDELVGMGGTRHVYRDPINPNRVIKIYDRMIPTLKTPPGAALSESDITVLIQRELALEDFLVSKGIPVARINRNPGLLRRGIILHELAEGVPLKGYVTGTNPAIDKALTTLARYDKQVAQIMERRFKMQIGHKNGDDFIPTGFDLGETLEHIIVNPKTGEFKLVDW